ncbi:MAG: glucuronate isomerase [Armatimonadota bacterium]
MLPARATDIHDIVFRAISETKITDMHTHLYSPAFGELLSWGIDELLTYHYLVAETMRWVEIPYEEFWAMTKREQADLIWRTLFIEHSPISEACRGVLTVLQCLGLDTSSRNLEDYRAYFARLTPEEYVEKVFSVASIESVVMTNDPFDDAERPVWEHVKTDPRFHAALRVDVLLNTWEKAVPALKGWGYRVSEDLNGETVSEVRRFLSEWIERTDSLYMAVSLPPSFTFPEASARGRLLEECVLPVALEKKIPLAMMIGVNRRINPALRMAGDGMGRSDVSSIERICAGYPENKFMVTMLALENQQELVVTARKFRNLMLFGCWWFLNNPSLIEEMTRMRTELLGISFVPQHSDCRVIDQLIYKWEHSKRIIGEVLAEKYQDLAATGWRVSEEEIRRDVADLFGGNFWRFVKG